VAFLLSVLALLLGPLVYAVGQRRPTARQVLDGFVFITIAGIVCVHIIPASIASGGLWALLFLVLGLAFPVLLERQFHRLMHRAHDFILLLAALGLAVHAMVDGIALLPLTPEASEAALESGSLAALVGLGPNQQLALGVILHRLPVGMAIWWSLRPQLGTTVAVALFALIIGASAFAYFNGDAVLRLAEDRTVAWFQAFVAGSLVHVVAFGVSHDHSGHIERRPAGSHWGYRVGVLLGLFLLFVAPSFH
jgi:hypothetical protein